MANPFGHGNPELPARILTLAYWLILVFFMIWGASLYWAVPDLPAAMRVFLPIAKGAGRGMTWTLCLLYISTLRSTQTAVRRLLKHHPDVMGWIAGAIPFHDIMPSMHAALGVVCFILALIHALVHCLDYIFFWGSPFWPITWNFSVGFDGMRGTGWLLITGCVLFLVFTSMLFVPGVGQHYCRNIPKDGKWKAFRKLTPSYSVFINLHWAGFALFTVFMSIHAQNQAYSDVTIMYWVLSVWTIIDLLFRYLPAGQNLVPISSKTYYDNGKPMGTLITLPRPPNYSFEAGQYALLRSNYFAEQETGVNKCMKQVEARESHPFSIASPETDTSTISFIIGKAQGWTSRIFDAVDNQNLEGNPVTFTITRPQGAPAQDHKMYDAVLLVGTGVGCTAMMSVFHSLITTPHAVDAVEEPASSPEPRHGGKSWAPSWAIGVQATVITFVMQLAAALMVILALIVPNSTDLSDLVILGIDTVINGVVIVIIVLRVLWFASELQNDTWTEAKGAMRTLLMMDALLLLIGLATLSLDAYGLSANDQAHELMETWVAPATIALTALSIVTILVRIWIYLYYHSPRSYGGQFPKIARMVLSSSSHMDACEALLGSVLDTKPETNLDWGALLKVSGSGKQPYDVTTFGNIGVTRHDGARFKDADFVEMIRILVNKLHGRHTSVERPYFLGVFYCGNQPSVKEALIRGAEQVQVEHLASGCNKCYARVLCEQF